MIHARNDEKRSGGDKMGRSGSVSKMTVPVQQEQKLVAISRQELVEIMQVVARTVTNTVRESSQLKLPIYYKFPEDIMNMTGGYIAEATIRSWKSAGYLRTVKIGTKAFVKPDDWEWFLVHHKELMAKNPRNRRIQFSKKKK